MFNFCVVFRNEIFKDVVFFYILLRENPLRNYDNVRKFLFLSHLSSFWYTHINQNEYVKLSLEVKRLKDSFCRGFKVEQEKGNQFNLGKFLRLPFSSLNRRIEEERNLFATNLKSLISSLKFMTLLFGSFRNLPNFFRFFIQN